MESMRAGDRPEDEFSEGWVATAFQEHTWLDAAVKPGVPTVLRLSNLCTGSSKGTIVFE